ncbi:MAG: exodeoxyribonuclease III [Myxococcota bacterium]
MKLLSWNVNGLRAAERAGFLDWFARERAFAVCVQEIKARPEELKPELCNPLGYHSYFHPAERPGYSGVATFTRREPLDVRYGLGSPEFDREGRVLRLEFPDFVLVNAYFPNSQRDHARLDYKLAFCAAMLRLVNRTRAAGKHVLLCGDYNICHRAIDLANARQNEKNAGYLPEERAWMERFLTRHGWVDTFRSRCPEPGHYTWWSYRPGVRARNVGWRLDYFVANREIQDRVARVRHQSDVRGSDHCPVELALRA